MSVGEMVLKIRRGVNCYNVASVCSTIYLVLVMLLVVIPSGIEFYLSGTTQNGFKHLFGFSVAREFSLKDQGVAITTGSQVVDGITERLPEGRGRIVESIDTSNPVLKDGDDDRHNDSSKRGNNSFDFHLFRLWFAYGAIFFSVCFIVLYVIWLRYKLAVYDKALGDIGVTLVGSPFRRGEEGVTASIFDSIAFLATLEKDLRALDLMLVSSIVPIASKHAPHGGDDAKLPDARIAVKNYRGEET